LTYVVAGGMQPALQRTSGAASEPTTPVVRLILRAAGLALLFAGFAAPAAAAPVLVFDHGRVTREQDPFLPAQAGPVSTRPPARAAAFRTQNVRVVLQHMLQRGQIDQSGYDDLSKDYDDALFIRGQLAGTPRRELTAVISDLNGFASHGQLTPSRLAVLWLQLNRNTEWWGLAARVPRAGERIAFRGSRVIWQ